MRSSSSRQPSLEQRFHHLSIKPTFEENQTMELFSGQNRLISLILFLILTSVAPGKLPFFASAADPNPTVNDEGVTVDVARWFYWGQTANDLSGILNKDNARFNKLRVEDPNVPTFAASLVENTGDYGTAWWWYYGQTAQQVGQLLSQHNARLISVDPYFTSGGLRFAVVMVPNTGAQDRAWWWYYGQSAQQVGQLLSQNNARLVELRPYNDNGQQVFAVIMISNTGEDAERWEWWYGKSVDFISTRIQTGLRVVALAPDPFGTWSAILDEADNYGWWWWYGQSGNQVLSNIGAHNSRLVDLSSYVANGQRQYAVVELAMQ